MRELQQSVTHELTDECVHAIYVKHISVSCIRPSSLVQQLPEICICGRGSTRSICLLDNRTWHKSGSSRYSQALMLMNGPAPVPPASTEPPPWTPSPSPCPRIQDYEQLRECVDQQTQAVLQ